jgi:hypothetical protein
LQRFSLARSAFMVQQPAQLRDDWSSGTTLPPSCARKLHQMRVHGDGAVQLIGPGAIGAHQHQIAVGLIAATSARKARARFW